MNRFFANTAELSFEPPRRALARFDQCEPTAPAEMDAPNALVAFEAVDFDWLEKASGAFNPNTREGQLEQSWRSHWQRLKQPDQRAGDPFAGLPIYRFELTVDRDDEIFHEIEKYQVDPRWKLFESGGAYPVDVFGNLFTAPVTAPYRISNAPGELERGLDILFGMQTWPDASAEEISQALGGAAIADYLAVYDVGQGSANALLDDGRLPRLYFDLGCGVYRNAHTSPKPLAYCWTKQPPVVLSHWDADHWAGALKDPNALPRSWVAPRQSIGPVHAAFASSIAQAGGRILLWGGSSFATVTVGSLARPIELSRCTGTGRNGSGLALTVEDKHTGQSWLATGDAGYHELLKPPAANLSAVVVPHHGADMGPRSVPPSPPSSLVYRRLLYSFGDGNRHGRTAVQHPTANAVGRHRAAGWLHGTWAGASPPGCSIATQDVRETAVHGIGHRGGAIVGWSSPPNLSATPCGARLGAPSRCSISLDQN